MRRMFNGHPAEQATKTREPRTDKLDGMTLPPKIVRRGSCTRPQSNGDHEGRERLGVPRLLRQRILEIGPRLGELAFQHSGDAARGEEVRRGEGWVAQLLGVERVRVGVGVFACDEPDRGLDELQQQIVLRPALRAVVLLLG
jgi:hypothetical protein